MSPSGYLAAVRELCDRYDTLLIVANYNFSWQVPYRWEPGKKRLPKGTRLRCVAHYDNSVNNIANPDPNALSPQIVEITLTDGHRIERHVPHTLGAPDAPLSPAQADAKRDLALLEHR